MDQIISKIYQLREHLDMMYAVPTAKKEDISYKILTKFLEIVSIFVSFPINVILKTGKMVELFGKLYSNSKSMQFMNALNLGVISAIKKNFSI